MERYYVIYDKENRMYRKEAGTVREDLIHRFSKYLNDMYYPTEYKEYEHLLTLDFGYTEESIHDILIDNFENTEREEYVSRYGFEAKEVTESFSVAHQLYFENNHLANMASKEDILMVTHHKAS